MFFVFREERFKEEAEKLRKELESANEKQRNVTALKVGDFILTDLDDVRRSLDSPVSFLGMTETFLVSVISVFVSPLVLDCEDRFCVDNTNSTIWSVLGLFCRGCKFLVLMPGLSGFVLMPGMKVKRLNSALFAGNKTSRGVGRKCTYKTIAKHGRIIWLDKKQ